MDHMPEILGDLDIACGCLLFFRTEEIIKRAKIAGYKEMVLDTIVPLKAAISLYKRHGFEECEAYYHNPMDDVIYMRKAL